METFDPTTATLTDLDHAIAESARELDRIERRLTEARSRHRSIVDDNPLAKESETIRQELDTLRRPALDIEEENAERDAEAVRARLLAIARATGAGQPTLPSEQMTQAADKLPFIERQCTDWPLDKLREALRYALGADDRPALYCYAQILPGRLAAVSATDGERTDPHRGRLYDPAHREKTELSRMLRVARERLTDRGPEKLNRQAHELATRGFDLAADAGKRRREKERESRVYAFQTPGEVSVRTGEPRAS